MTVGLYPTGAAARAAARHQEPAHIAGRGGGTPRPARGHRWRRRCPCGELGKLSASQPVGANTGFSMGEDPSRAVTAASTLMILSGDQLTASSKNIAPG